MLRDVFYYGKKPNVHPREQFAENLTDARIKATTRDFWIINEFCDYRNFDWDFDFEFLPDEDVWAEDHNNVWPSQHQKDSGTWLCPKEHSDIIIYRNDVDPIRRKNEKTDNWVELDLIDHSKFDFSWHPDPTSPPYIYKWGCKFYPAQIKHVLEYHVPGATQTKFMDTIAELMPDSDRWIEYQEVDKSRFDMSWRPNPLDPPFIYVWGNKYIDGTLRPTLEYHMPDAVDKKYMSELVPVLPEWDKWVEIQKVDKNNFDFSWRPDPREPAYIYTWGNKYIDAELRPTLEYHTEGATERKYMTNDVSVLPEQNRWKIIEDIIKDSFDFSWRPDPREPAFIYVFGNEQYNGAIMPTVEYHCPGATEIKYIDDIKAKLKPNKSLFEHLEDSYLTDYSWRPDPTSPPYIYAWGNQWNSPEVKISIQYVVPGATEYKYMSERAIRKPCMDNWTVLKDIDNRKFDFSWEPDYNSPAYIYVFGNQWHSAERMPTVKYTVPGATEEKYVSDIIANLKPNMTYWDIPKNLIIRDFDFSWVPDPYDPPYNYVFGNQWYPAEEMATVIYKSPEANEDKFISDIRATLGNNLTNWEIPKDIDVRNFDFSWLPHPAAPAYIYQFGTKLDNNNGPRYITPNNTGEIVYLPYIEHEEDLNVMQVGQYYIETTLMDLVQEHPNEVFWALRKNIDYTNFDFTWRPMTVEVAWELDYVHVFGSSESELTHTYFISAKHFLEGKTSYKYVEDIKLTNDTLTALFAKPDIFYVDRGNIEANERYELLKNKLGNTIQKTRYLNSWVDTISRCTNRATSELIWVLDSELDYSNFNFDYYPNPWQMNMVHVFGTQWSHWGTTFMVNRETFKEDTKYIKIIEHLSNLNFVKTIRAVATKCIHDIVLIDHGNRETDLVHALLKTKAPDKTITIVSYDESYLKTLREIVNKQQVKKDHYIWICSSVCDYTTFDFSYICDPFAKDQLHVFPSGIQKFGDTFFVDVNKAREVINEIDTLENFVKVNYNGTVKAKRFIEPTIVVSDDTHTNSIGKITDFPYATLITSDNADIEPVEIEPMNLWSNETKNIYVTSTGATRIVVPKEINNHVTKELYEYPYIKRANKLALSKPLDIVFLSNGETCADEHYDHLLKVTNGLSNRIVRVDGINGRAKAYHAAAEASETPWMFTVFAKLKINPKFDFNWQPDRMQVPKHYIFHAKNPVNGLVYGHQAMIAYNKKLTLANQGHGLDFTLDDEHEVVPLISGTAHYNTDSFSTWRTAFREVLKLKADDSEESRIRLGAWLNNAEGDYAQFSIKGALDAVEYYDEVNGDFAALKLSYEWSWLRDKFDNM